jgi:hypothetical protein
VVQAAAPPKIAPEPPACITLPDEATAITHAAADGMRVRYCINGNLDQCFVMDPATGSFERLREKPQHSSPVARVETVNPDIKVCTLDACKSLTPKVLPNAATIRAATTDDGTIAVFLLGDATRGRGYAEVWNVERARRMAKFRYARGIFKCGDVSILGDTIFVAASLCNAPGARGRLYTLRGRRIANVGGRDFGVYGKAFTQLDEHVWAFLEENGAKIAIQNVKRGRVLKRIDTSNLFLIGGARMGNPGESALVRLADGKLAVIAGAPALGSVATVDVETGDVEVRQAPICQSSQTAAISY